MSKTRRTLLTKEEVKEHHEAKKKKREQEEKYLAQFLEEQYEELRHSEEIWDLKQKKDI